MRLLRNVPAGLAVAIFLFLLMSQMISGERQFAGSANTALNLDFIRLDLDEVENIRRRIPPPEPEPLEALPTLPRLTDMPENTELPSLGLQDMPVLDIAEVRFDSSLQNRDFRGVLDIAQFTGDGDLYPVISIEPIYPSAAIARRLTGWVDLEYTVLPDGSVTDAVAIQSSARGAIFEGPAVEAILRWKFKPRVVDGQAVAVRVSQRIIFNTWQE